MITKMFAVYDSKAQVYGTPFCMGTIGLALRAFTDLAKDPQSTVSKYPQDFSLFQVGEYDDQLGQVSASVHINLGLAASVLPSRPYVDGVVGEREMVS